MNTRQNSSQCSRKYNHTKNEKSLSKFKATFVLVCVCEKKLFLEEWVQKCKRVITRKFWQNKVRKKQPDHGKIVSFFIRTTHTEVLVQNTLLHLNIIHIRIGTMLLFLFLKVKSVLKYL